MAHSKPAVDSLKVTELTLRLEAGGPVWRVWPEAEEIPAGAIGEARSYLFELEGSSAALAAELVIDGTELEALRSRDPAKAIWRWKPGFHAGVVEATLLVPASGPRHFKIVTDPDRRKLTRDNFDTMVREILQDSFALFSLSSFRKGIARGNGREKSQPPLARMEFLCSRVDEIVKQVEAIARRPCRFLNTEETISPLHKVKRLTGTAILKSYVNGKLGKITNPSRHLPEYLPTQVINRRHGDSLDIPEHRQIKACLRSWASWLGATSEGLQKREKVSLAKAAWIRRLQKASRALHQLCDLPMFRQVGSGVPSVSCSPIFRKDARYNAFYRLYQDMNLGMAALFGDFLQMPLAHTYDLYELWCYLRLVRAAVEELGCGEVSLDELFLRNDYGEVTLANQMSLPVGGYSLCFQKEYREYWVEKGGRGSFSRNMTPDVAIIKNCAAETESGLIILDAKYRIKANLNESLNSIHTYRDALVHEVETGQVKGIVKAAYLLTPYIPELKNGFKQTEMPSRLFHPNYRKEFKFGAVTMKPGMDLHEVTVVLREIIKDATTTAAGS